MSAALARHQEVTDAYARARSEYLASGRDAAVAILRDAFPWATTATFTRDWDSDIVVLEQVSDGTREQSLLTDAFWRDGHPELRDVPGEARLYIEAMGSDVHDYLEDATADDAGHDTYVLDLTEASR